MVLQSGAFKERFGFMLIAVIATIAAIFLLLHDPIPQDIKYHHFADTREIFSIPNFWNVLSNLPFLLVGGLGLFKLSVSKSLNIIDEAAMAYIVFFAGVTLVSLGSAYYHLWPDNQTLVWDRLPMTIAFMALCAIVVGEFISVKLGKALLWPAIAFGIFSVVYWHVTELNGKGDLRLYGFVQFFPVLAIPVIFICFRSRCGGVNGYVALLLAYVVAKIAEYFDTTIYNVSGAISGHSLKHIIVALGIYVLIVIYAKRRLT